MNRVLNFIVIDFETATTKRSTICEVGICESRDGQVVEIKSWLLRPEGNAYSYWNTKVHGIRPEDTTTAPSFPEVWAEIEQTYIVEYNSFVAHNTPPWPQQIGASCKALSDTVTSASLGLFV